MVVVAVAASSADSATILHVLAKGVREMEMETGSALRCVVEARSAHVDVVK